MVRFLLQRIVLPAIPLRNWPGFSTVAGPFLQCVPTLLIFPLLFFTGLYNRWYLRCILGLISETEYTGPWLRSCHKFPHGLPCTCNSFCVEKLAWKSWHMSCLRLCYLSSLFHEMRTQSCLVSVSVDLGRKVLRQKFKGMSAPCSCVFRLSSITDMICVFDGAWKLLLNTFCTLCFS